jgi:hypothetical protein
MDWSQVIARRLRWRDDAMTRCRILAVLLIGAAPLAACGGGGGNRPPDAGPPPAIDMGGGTDLGGARDLGPGMMDMGPPVAMDGGGSSMCPRGACDLLSNGCMGPGEGCYYLLPSPDASMPEPLCDTAGLGTSGMPCTSYSNCASGHICDDGMCRKLCCALGTQGGCPLGFTCAISLLGPGGVVTGVGLCDAPMICTLLDSSMPCTGRNRCYVVAGSAQCASAGDTPIGGSCMFANSCVPGSACVGGTCRQVCDTTGAGPTCTTGTCTSVGLPAPNENAGVCVM